jgi:hypothetical protein
MRRLIVACAAIALIFANFSNAPITRAAGPPTLLCSNGRLTCAEVYDAEAVFGDEHYVGHDEPSLLFYSNTSGSGNSNHYVLKLPFDPPTLPTQDGTGGTFNFQLHPAFWFGMAMCDTESAPNFSHTCTPDSDGNIFDSANPADGKYIGKHPGTAFMEMQFYAPGWVHWPAGDSCDPEKWCAALNIDSLSTNQNTGVSQNSACLSTVGVEPVNFAFITRDGASIAPADPVRATLETFTPHPDKVLMMHSGDTLVVDMHDTPAGFQVLIQDTTSGQSGSMTASIANSFGQVIFDPAATTCSSRPYAFHPMYATSSEHTRVVWAAHTYNVAFSDEIGHFEYCNAVGGQTGSCTQDGAGDRDATLSGFEDDNFCFAPPFTPPFQATKVKVGGCFGTDTDFDGVGYQHTWPGSLSDPAIDASRNPSSILFTSPLFNATQSYDRVAFEADLPRIEFDTNPRCNRTSGANCVNPPVGATFYPFYSTRSDGAQCLWQLGGAHIPGTTNTFGGSSTAEFGPLLQSTYPGVGFVSFQRYNNFRQILASNPCT